MTHQKLRLIQMAELYDSVYLLINFGCKISVGHRDFFWIICFCLVSVIRFFGRSIVGWGLDIWLHWFSSLPLIIRWLLSLWRLQRKKRKDTKREDTFEFQLYSWVSYNSSLVKRCRPDIRRWNTLVVLVVDKSKFGVFSCGW